MPPIQACRFESTINYMMFIKKTLAIIFGVIAGLALWVLLMLPITLTGGSRPAPYFGMAAAAICFFGGRWVYRKICNLLLKKKDVELVYESKSIYLDEPSEETSNESITYESEELKL